MTSLMKSRDLEPLFMARVQSFCPKLRVERYFSGAFVSQWLRDSVATGTKKGASRNSPFYYRRDDVERLLQEGVFDLQLRRAAWSIRAAATRNRLLAEILERLRHLWESDPTSQSYDQVVALALDQICPWVQSNLGDEDSNELELPVWMPEAIEGDFRIEESRSCSRTNEVKSREETLNTEILKRIQSVESDVLDIQTLVSSLIGLIGGESRERSTKVRDPIAQKRKVAVVLDGVLRTGDWIVSDDGYSFVCKRIGYPDQGFVMDDLEEHVRSELSGCAQTAVFTVRADGRFDHSYPWLYAGDNPPEGGTVPVSLPGVFAPGDFLVTEDTAGRYDIRRIATSGALLSGPRTSGINAEQDAYRVMDSMATENNLVFIVRPGGTLTRYARWIWNE